MPNLSDLLNEAANNVSTCTAVEPVPVLCAWPVSGQYGPGSRILYYVLVAACVFARKTDWLRNACLAAALLFPAVAAIHGIVLAALHVNGAADMDVYGAFQFCSIGILAAPVTVKLSTTYFYDPGRNVIFLWTVLILAGLLSLTIEFWRISPLNCPCDDHQNPNPTDPHTFLYPSNANCSNITCSVEEGPFSPMRSGSANNIYIIPAPDRLTLNAATLVAAACCIPAILSLMFMWIKIIETNSGRNQEDEEQHHEPIEGTNGATIEGMQGINNFVRIFLSVIEAPVFGGAVLCILIFGEWNFWSWQVAYQTEPIASIGQWAPIAGTGLAALGSLYLFIINDVETLRKEQIAAQSQGIDSRRHHDINSDRSTESLRDENRSLEPRNDRYARGIFQSPVPESPAMEEVGLGILAATTSAPLSSEDDTNTRFNELARTTTKSTTRTRSSTVDAGGRHKAARAILALGHRLGNSTTEDYDEFKSGKARDFPLIPGEEQRNEALPQIREIYDRPRDADGRVTPLPREGHSRPPSFISVASARDNDEDQTPHSPRSPSPLPSPTSPRRPRVSTLPAMSTSSETNNPNQSPSAGRPLRRDTLDVPSPLRLGHTRSSPSASSIPPITSPSEGEISPTILISRDLDERTQYPIPGPAPPPTIS